MEGELNSDLQTFVAGLTRYRIVGRGRRTDGSVAPRLDDLEGTYGSAMSESSDADFDFGRNLRVANLTQLPAITIPNGFVDSAPAGLQLIGDAFDDASLLGAAAGVESVIGETVEE